MHPAVIQSKLAQYEEDGYCKIESLLNTQDLVDIEKDIQQIIANEASQLSGRDINYSDGVLNSIHCLHRFKDKYFKNLLENKKIFEIASQFLHDEAELRAMELFAKPARVGLPSPLHQDDYYWCLKDHNALTVWIALNDVDETNGGVEYYKGSHKLGILDHEDSFAPGSSQTISDKSLIASLHDKREILTLKPGDCLIHHALTFHGSGPNKSDRPRRGLTLQIKGKNSEYDLSRKQHYEARLMEQIANRESRA